MSASASSSSSSAELGEVGVDLVALRVENAHVEPLRASSHRASDAAEADDAERRARYLLDELEPSLGPRAGPASRADEAISDRDLATACQDEREGEIGRGVRENAGRVRDDDAALEAGGDTDPVVADAEVGDDAEVREKIERNGLVGDDEAFDVGSRGVELCERSHLDVEELVERRSRIAPGREDLHEGRYPDFSRSRSSTNGSIASIPSTRSSRFSTPAQSSSRS